MAVEITEVLMAPAPAPGLLRYHLDAPTAGKSTDIYAVPFEGWVMTEDSPPVGLEITRPEAFVDTLPIGVPRPDLQKIYPDLGWARASGFRSAITSLRLPHEFELDVSVVCADGARIPLFTVRGRHRPTRLSEAAMRPLIITTLGRSGSTWVQQLLADHPEIVSYPPFKNDVRVASYWLDVLLALSEPASYRQALTNYNAAGDWWLGRPRRPDEYFGDPDALRWLGREQVESLARFCRERIEGFYASLAERQDTASPSYFLEKRLPSNRRQIIPLRELFPGTREVFVVRDFRDMLCSILAFNQKVGAPRFGRELVDSDEAYVRKQLAGSVEELEGAWRERAGWAHLVRYEDLVLKPHETARSLLAFLELGARDEDVERFLTVGSTNGDERQRRHMTTANVRESVGRWRQDLSPELVVACEEAFDEAFATFGYATGSAPAQPRRAQKSSTK